MAEILAVRVALSVAWKLFAPRTASKIENGDVAEEKLRQLLLNEFQKLHEHLNALRRKELVAAVAFLETGYDLLHKDATACKEEFRKARDASLMAFGVVPEVADKVLATKILILSAIHEFKDNKETAKTLCQKYLSRMNSLPEVAKICQVTFDKENNLKSKFLGLTGKTARHDLLRAVADTNYSLWEFFIQEFPLDVEPWPRIVWDKSNIHPIHDLSLLRSTHVVAELDFNIGTIISSAVCQNYIFCAVSHPQSQTDQQNNITAIDLQTSLVRNLIGHSSNVLSLAATSELLFSAAYDKKIMVWNASNLSCIKILETHTGSVRSLCLSETYLFSGSTDSTVGIWSLEKLELCQKIQIGCPVSYVTCSKKKFLFCLTAIGRVQIWDMMKLSDASFASASFELTVGNNVSKLITSDNIMFACSRDSVELIKLGSLRKESTMDAPGYDCVLTSSNKYLICKENGLSLWSTRTGKCILTENVTDNVMVIEYIWTHKGALFASCRDQSAKRFFILKL